MALQRLRRRSGRVGTPEGVDKNRGFDDVPCPDGQDLENRTLLGRVDGDETTLRPHLERAEDPDLHAPTLHPRALSPVRHGSLMPESNVLRLPRASDAHPTAVVYCEGASFASP